MTNRELLKIAVRLRAMQLELEDMKDAVDKVDPVTAVLFSVFANKIVSLYKAIEGLPRGS